VPSAFPDIKPLKPEDVEAFAAKRVPPVLESDSVEKKILKAKLRVALNQIANEFASLHMTHTGPPPPPYEATTPELLRSVREAVATALLLVDRPEDRRAWLEFGVGVCKTIEEIFVERVKRGIERPSMAWLVRRYRLDAELTRIALEFPPGK